MSLLRTPLAVAKWTWSRTGYNMVSCHNMISCKNMVSCHNIASCHKLCFLSQTRQALRRSKLGNLDELSQTSIHKRYCTSSPPGNKTANKPEIKSMPNNLTELVTKTNDASWPSLQNISLLALRLEYFLLNFSTSRGIRLTITPKMRCCWGVCGPGGRLLL